VDEATIAAKVQDHFGDKILGTYQHAGQHAVVIGPEHIREMLCWLRDQPDLDFNMLMDLGGVDYKGYDDRDHRFEVVYQMYSMDKNHRFRIKVAVRDDSVSVPTVWDLYRVANWMEREVFDMYGVRFSDHPNLRRILCHDDFKGHALRKDYPINKRQLLSRPVEMLLTDDPDHA
jgi:NADH-quinone oxidoreductase subunit C